MQEIKDNHAEDARSRTKRFWILWTVATDCVVEVRARNKEEALKMFEEGDFPEGDAECTEREMIGEPSLRGCQNATSQ